MNDGHELLYAAQLLEAQGVLVADAVDYVKHMTSFGETDALLQAAATCSGSELRQRYLPGMLRALFLKHAHTRRVRLTEAVQRWLPKLRELYGDVAVAPVQELLDEAEWEWDE